MLQRAKLAAPSLRRAIEGIDRATVTQSRLIEDILDVSRIVSGKLRIEPREVELTSIVRQAIDAALPVAESGGIHVTSALAALEPIVGDPERLQQVVANLLSNAIKYTPKGGSLAVRLAHAGDRVELSVADSGEGIAPELLPHVFERFHQGDTATTRRHTGLGLGLAIARHIVERHGGTIAVQSAGVGKGATFTVALLARATVQTAAAGPPGAVPAGGPPGAVPAGGTASAGPAGGRASAAPAGGTSARRRPARAGTRPARVLEGVRVLAVDDDRDICESMATVLDESGARVTIASSVGEALAQLASEAYDALVTDIAMPDEDGYSLIRRARELSGGKRCIPPAIALTAYASSTDRSRALEAGFEEYLTKPVNGTELVERLAALVHRAEGAGASPEAPRANG